MTMQDDVAMEGARDVSSVIKRVIGRLPAHWQHELKRARYHRQIKRRTFVTDEPEYALLDSLIKDGDWVIDVGANIGHYTRRFSQLVGATGRVIALEPVSETFDLLAANAGQFAFQNITLLNVAASDCTGLAGMSVPAFVTGMKNFYEAHLTKDAAELQVMTMSIDALQLPRRVSLVKIDAEGHEAAVLRGMTALLKRDAPVLIVENARVEIVEYLESLSYQSKRLPGSPNLVWQSAA